MKNIADISELLLQLGLSSSPTDEEQALARAALSAAQGAVRRFLRYDPVQATRTEYYPQNDFSRSGREVIWEASDTQAYTRRLAEEVSDELQLSHLPVRSITDLRIDYDGRSGTRAGSFGASTVQTEGTDFWPNYDGTDSDGNRICRDGILKSEGRWPDIPGSVKVIYVAGYTDEELHGQDSVVDASPIVEAVIDEAVRRVLKIYSRKKKTLAGFSGPFASEGLGDYNYSVDTSQTGRLVGGGMDLLPETEQKLQDFQRMDLGVL